jgi:hypothetical protein
METKCTAMAAPLFIIPNVYGWLIDHIFMIEWHSMMPVMID